MKEILLVIAVAVVAWLIAASASEFLSGDFRRRFEENERNKIIWKEELKQKGIEIDEDVMTNEDKDEEDNEDMQ